MSVFSRDRNCVVVFVVLLVDVLVDPGECVQCAVRPVEGEILDQHEKEHLPYHFPVRWETLDVSAYFDSNAGFDERQDGGEDSNVKEDNDDSLPNPLFPLDWVLLPWPFFLIKVRFDYDCKIEFKICFYIIFNWCLVLLTKGNNLIFFISPC